MSYTYLQEQGEESSADSFSGIAPYVLSRLNPTPEKSSSNDNETGICHGSRSGTTYQVSMESHGEESPKSSAGDSPARTSQQQTQTERD